MSAPASLNIPSAIASGIIASAPKLIMDARVTRAMTIPNANPEMITRGPVRQPISTI